MESRSQYAKNELDGRILRDSGEGVTLVARGSYDCDSMGARHFIRTSDKVESLGSRYFWRGAEKASRVKLLSTDSSVHCLGG